MWACLRCGNERKQNAKGPCYHCRFAGQPVEWNGKTAPFPVHVEVSDA